MKKFLVPLLVVVVIGLSGLFVARFLFGGDEKSNLKTQTVDEIGLTLSCPSDLTFRKELGDDYGKLRTLAFYIEKGEQNNPDYQLYALFLADKEATQADLEKAKTEMDKSTIKEVTIGGYKGIEGLILGPKTRYITILLKDNRLFSVSTIPPTEENRNLTNSILETFNFE